MESRITEAGDHDEEMVYPPSLAARALAQALVALARGEALVALGDVERGAEVVEEWMRGDGSLAQLAG